MKKLKADSLFSIFEKDDREIYSEHGMEYLMEDATTLIGMVVKGVENYYLIDNMYSSRYPEEYTSVRKSIKLKYFIRLVKYLERVKDIPSGTVEDVIEEFSQNAIYYAFTEMMNTFIEEEYYENCIIVKNYLELFSLQKLDV